MFNMLSLILLVPILLNLTGLIDTYLSKLFGKEEESGNISDSTATLMIIGGLMAVVVCIVSYIYAYDIIFDISIRDIYMLIGSGIFYGFAAWPYFQALKHENIENIIAYLQIIPIFTYIIANILLGESFSYTSIVLMFAIVLCAMLFSRDFESKKINHKGLGFMLVSALMYSISYVFFKIGGLDNIHISVSYFWEHIGVAIACLMFALPRANRYTTIKYFQNNGLYFSILNFINELVYLIGVLIINYLIIHYNIAFVSTISNGLQPIVGFVMVYISHQFRPHIYTRGYTSRQIFAKISLCIICFVLLYIFYYNQII